MSSRVSHILLAMLGSQGNTIVTVLAPLENDLWRMLWYRGGHYFSDEMVSERRGSLTPLQLETRFWGQNYLDVVYGGVRGL